MSKRYWGGGRGRGKVISWKLKGRNNKKIVTRGKRRLVQNEDKKCEG
jgi:hypothetical protein